MREEKSSLREGSLTNSLLKGAGYIFSRCTGILYSAAYSRRFSRDWANEAIPRRLNN